LARGGPTEANGASPGSLVGGTKDAESADGTRDDPRGVNFGGPAVKPIDDCARGGGVELFGGGRAIEGALFLPILLGEAVCARDGGGGCAGVGVADAPSFPLIQRLSSLS